MLDLVIIGGGPAGYVAALRAAQLGGQVGLVERERVGGTCLRRGCVPTKSLLTSAEVLDHCRRAADYGVKAADVSADLPQIVARKDKVVEQLTRGVEFLLKRAKVRLVTGVGRLAEPNVVSVEKPDGAHERIEARSVLVSTGSEPAELPGIMFDGTHILDSNDVLDLQEVPASMLIIGAGALGCEFATYFAALGTQVTIVEMMSQVLPTEDAEISQIVERELKKKKVKVQTNSKVEKVTRQGDGCLIDMSGGQQIAADRLLVSIGRSFNSAGIGLEGAGLRVERGRVQVNERMETNVPGIYAAGDVVGKILLAHVASAEGTVAAENAMGQRRVMDYAVVPRCTFTSPEVASVGYTEEGAKQAGIQVTTGVFPMRALGRAHALGEWAGAVKLVADARNDRLVGAHIVGARASELIGEMVLAMNFEATIGDLEEVIRAHPTMVEAIGEAAHVLHGRPLHV
ncbi:MAG: dihydrolipoyl dehydrogenase [Bacteroidetes bacterium]|nr:dihydrolipoyl dehydrogenase [Bacteroidota bacterium]MCL5026082.1 dihydrolipoyl dehydrogenase [Chloroflexota bacterium]